MTWIILAVYISPSFQFMSFKITYKAFCHVTIKKNFDTNKNRLNKQYMLIQICINFYTFYIKYCERD